MNAESINESQIKSVTRKIKALLAKTVEAGASEAEAMSAFTKAHELLEAYQLNLSDLDLREEGTQHIVQTMDIIARRLSKKVSKYCECKVWMSDMQPIYKFVKMGKNKKEKKIYMGQDYTKINFMGIKTDADFAEWLMLALASYVQGKEMSFLFSHDDATVEDTEDFTTGAIDRINERLQYEIDKRNANKAASTGRDLVPLKNAMITEAFAKLGITLNTTTPANYRVMNAQAYMNGQQAGNGVSFNRPVSSEDRSVKLLR